MAITPQAIHEIEQLGAFAREMARELGAFRKELLDQDFRPDEAFALTQIMEEALLGGLLDRGEELVEE